jgi:hypothetical protein
MRVAGGSAMAVATLLDGRTELSARGYSRFVSASPSRATVWLNAAKNRFEDYPYDWPWLKTSTTGTAPVTISDLRRVLSVADTTNRTPLEPVNADAITEYGDTNLALVGPAQAWYLSAETVLTTYPVGSGTLSVRYVKFSPELSADGDAPLIPLRYRSTWIDLAEAEALRYGVKDVATAAALEASVFARLREIAGVYAMQDQQAFTESLMTGASTDS